jgi:hypothetical protein
MHKSHYLENKNRYLFLSTYAISIGYSCVQVDTVSKRNKALQEKIMASPMNMEYITHMHGVDVVDQLKVSYYMQGRTRKWWNKILFFTS